MARKGNKTGQWAQSHINDPYVKKAQGEGYRSRAVYKLKEIDDQDRLLSQAKVIVDLGAAPGGWSQYIGKKFKNKTVIAIDLLPIDPIDGVHIIQGDFQDDVVLEALDTLLAGQHVDLVISDMAPNITGVRSVDEAQFEDLLQSVLDFCHQRLKPGGHLLAKCFEGSAAHTFRSAAKRQFKRCIVRKPAASRSKSREFYLLAKQSLK